MDDLDQPARQPDRDRAIRSVESAWAAGQIVEADRDKRVDELRRARTLREVEMLVHDLRPAGYEQLPATPVAPDPVEPEPTARTARTAPPAATRTGTPRLVVLLVAVLVVVTVGGAVAGIVGAVSSVVSTGDAVTDSPTLAPGVEADDDEINLFSVSGYDDLLADLEEQFGNTEVFNAVLYPTYAVMDVPVDATSQRKQSFYWNGELDEPSGKGTSPETRYDLREVDLEVVIRLVETVRARVEDPTSWYVILHAPRADDDTVVQVYASNEYSESAYLLATANGTVTYHSEPTPPA